MICIQFIPRPEEVRRSIIGGKIHGKAATIAMEVLRCPLNVVDATFLMGKLVAVYVVVLLIRCGLTIICSTIASLSLE